MALVMARQPELSNPGSLLALWYGVLAGPIAFMTQFQLKFMMVPWACAIGSQIWLDVVTVIALTFPITAGLLSWRMWIAAGPSLEDEQGGQVGRTRAMAICGLALSAMFALAMVAQMIPVWIIGACQ
jgi:hypothetical protein